MPPLEITETTIKNILTRTSGYLRTVTSHSVQPYRGCTFGNALCGVGCYVRHNGHVLRGRRWGAFLEVRTNAADSYLEYHDREADWAARNRQRFSIFLSSSTDPFVPQEFRFGVTRRLLEAMRQAPPDELVLQTHSHQVVEYADLYLSLAERCDLRIHVTIETDRDRLPGLPPPASSVERRFEACRQLRAAGLRTVVTVSPLLPISKPERFFDQIAEAADAVVIDHFIEGDGSSDGSRTRRTALPAAMAAVCPESLSLDYRDRMVELACRAMPGQVGVNINGFAGRYLADAKFR
jgi:DNA repair photolyase